MKTVMIPLCLTIIFLSGLVSVGGAAQVAPDDWKAMQQIQELLRSKSWMKAGDIAPLLPVREKLTEFIQRYGGALEVRVWSDSGTIPAKWQGLDLSDDTTVHAYLTERYALPAEQRANWSYPASLSLGELLCRAQAAIGLKTDDVDALAYAVQWTEDYLASKTGGDTLFGVPGWYYPCVERLVLLQGKTVSPFDWQTMQRIQLLLRSNNWTKAEDIGPVLEAREQLQRLIQRYGPDFRSRIWFQQGAIPTRWKALDLSDETAVAAYETERASLPSEARRNWASLISRPLSELLAVAQAVVGLRTDDIDALRYAVGWEDEFIARMRQPRPDGLTVMFGIPGWYHPCQEKLSKLEGKAE